MSTKNDINNKAVIIPPVIGGVILGAVILYLASIIHRKNKDMHMLVKSTKLHLALHIIECFQL